jgi:hypothetical protein
LFSNKKSQFGQIWDGLAMEDVGMFYGHLVHFTVFCYILCTFGIVRGNLVFFSRCGIFYQEKSGNPATKSNFCFHFLNTHSGRKLKVKYYKQYLHRQM